MIAFGCVCGEINMRHCPVHANGDVTLASGMVRGSTVGKVNYLLVHDGPMYERWAEHLTAHADTKGKRNWLNAHDADDLERFREGACRHFVQWLRGETDEDHAAALFFNVNGAEHVTQHLLDS